MQTICDRSSIAKVMVVVEDGVRECRSHVSDLLCLCHKVQCTMLNKLQDIRRAVRTVQIDISLLLRDEGLVALRFEELPCTDEVLHHVDVRAGLDVEVTGIEETTDIQTGNELIGLVLGVCARSLTVQVEMVTLRCLQVALLKRFSVPGTIALVHIHMIHMNRYPYVGGGIGDLVVHMPIDEEIVGTRFAVLDIVDSRLTDGREIKLHIIIFEIGSPRLDGTLKGLLCHTVGTNAHQRGCGLGLIVLVEFDDGHLRLFGSIAYLGESDVRLTDPTRDGMRLYGPSDHLARLSGR